MKITNTKAAKSAAARQRLVSSPLSVTWYKVFRCGFLPLFAIMAAIVCVTDVISITMTQTAEIQTELATDSITLLLVYYIVSLVLMAASGVFSVILCVKLGVLDTACYKLLKVYLWSVMGAFAAAEIAGSAVKQIVFTQSDTVSVGLYAVTVLLVCGAVVWLNLKYFKKRSYLFEN